MAFSPGDDPHEKSGELLQGHDEVVGWPALVRGGRPDLGIYALDSVRSSFSLVEFDVVGGGDFSTEILVSPQRDNVIRALAILHGAVGLDPNGLRLHKEDPETTHRQCPGSNVVESIKETIARIPGMHREHAPGIVSCLDTNPKTPGGIMIRMTVTESDNAP
jgi:hypothetical protein